MNEVAFAELVSKMAHDLRSPLTSIKGFSSTMISRWDRFSDEQKRQFVETIHADAERMARIVSEVLDLARIEAGRLELRHTIVDLSAAAGKAAAALGALPGAERILVDVPPELTCWADEERLVHVFVNLLENGIKFSDSGPVRLSASNNGSGMTTVAVADSGVGIDAARLPDIFSGPAGPGGHAAPSGSGLGLYLTRRLIEAHGGSVEVESTPGEGTTFTIMLPAQEPA